LRWRLMTTAGLELLEIGWPEADGRWSRLVRVGRRDHRSIRPSIARVRRSFGQSAGEGHLAANADVGEQDPPRPAPVDSRMLAGLTSRCNNPCSCAKSNASAMASTMSTTSASTPSPIWKSSATAVRRRISCSERRRSKAGSAAWSTFRTRAARCIYPPRSSTSTSGPPPRARYEPTAEVAPCRRDGQRAAASGKSVLPARWIFIA
jgi:hypothetical protein